ncbi:MAG: hypothetical protein KGL70_07525 [Betaproteobacteria bacterium]|nr:hypothetical protein [Betaproteobacteria bacterium]
MAAPNPLAPELAKLQRVPDRNVTAAESDGANRLWRLLELAQGEQQAVGLAVADGSRKELDRRGTGTIIKCKHYKYTLAALVTEGAAGSTRSSG